MLDLRCADLVRAGSWMLGSALGQVWMLGSGLCWIWGMGICFMLDVGLCLRSGLDVGICFRLDLGHGDLVCAGSQTLDSTLGQDLLWAGFRM